MIIDRVTGNRLLLIFHGRNLIVRASLKLMQSSHNVAVSPHFQTSFKNVIFSFIFPQDYQYLVGYHIQIDSPSEYCGDARIITIEEVRVILLEITV